DVAVELDVVQVKLRRFDLQRFLFVQVAQVQKIFVTKHRVVVEVDLRIERDQAIVFREQERIDLQQRRVHLLVRVVERLHKFHRLADQIGTNPEAKREFSRLKTAKTDRRVNRLFQNLFGRVRRNF